jgi:hypothetical protein
MGTKVLLFAARCLALALGLSGAVLVTSPRTAYAVDANKARSKIVDLNKQAILSYEAKDFETAKTLLNKALKEAKQSGLEDDKMTARTYVHLGAVYWVGFQDQATAVQNFALAKKIRPDIQLTPSIETPDLRTVFELAAVDAEPTPAPEATPAPSPSSRSVKPAARPSAPAAPSLTSGPEEEGEPDLPDTMAAPLMCAVPEDARAGKDLAIRCALKPGINAKIVQLHYRVEGGESFQVLPMKRTPKGWYLATLPGHMVKGKSLQVYFDAQGAGDNVLASNGQIDSPSIIEVRKKGAARGAAGGDDEDPMKKIRDQQSAEAYEAGLHRRREGAVWIGLGGGAGFGAVPGGPLEWETDIRVTSVRAPTGLFNFLPELGYMISDTFAMSLQARAEFIQQQQLAASIRTGAPTTNAFALFARAIHYTDLTDGGNFQLSLSGDLGGGYIRIPVKPIAKYNGTDPNTGQPLLDNKNSIAKTDTRPIGPVLFGVSGGFIYHVSRHFALALDARVLSGLGNYGAVIEGIFSAQFAFFGKAGPAKPVSDDEGEVGNEPASDQPPPAEAPPEE